jgi:hypothetical protein
MAKFSPIAIAVLAALAPACSYQLASPPARIVTLESARTLAPHETVIAAKGTAQSAIFDPGIIGGTVLVRHGVADHVEVNSEVSYVRVQASDEDTKAFDLDPSIYAGHVGAKLSAGRNVALTAGVGGGYAPAAGGFGAVDLGGIVSYDNCYVVPFVAISGLVSQPIGAKTVNFGWHGSSRATTTLGFFTGTGIEVPLRHAPCREGRATPKFQLGVSLTVLQRTEHPITQENGGEMAASSGDYGSIGVMGGVEVPF